MANNSTPKPENIIEDGNSNYDTPAIAIDSKNDSHEEKSGRRKAGGKASHSSQDAKSGTIRKKKSADTPDSEKKTSIGSKKSTAPSTAESTDEKGNTSSGTRGKKNSASQRKKQSTASGGNKTSSKRQTNKNGTDDIADALAVQKAESRAASPKEATETDTAADISALDDNLTSSAAVQAESNPNSSSGVEADDSTYEAGLDSYNPRIEDDASSIQDISSDFEKASEDKSAIITNEHSSNESKATESEIENSGDAILAIAAPAEDSTANNISDSENTEDAIAAKENTSDDYITENAIAVSFFGDEAGNESTLVESDISDVKSGDNIAGQISFFEEEKEVPAYMHQIPAFIPSAPKSGHIVKKKAYDSEHPRKSDTLFDVIELFIFSLIFMLIITSFFMRHSVVSGGSMDRTLADGEHLMVSDFLYTPKQGDIVVVYLNQLKKPIVKRVIATGGDHLTINYLGEVYVNDEKLDETEYVFIDGPVYYTPVDIIIPEGEIFVMGDHRNDSLDSRAFGTLDEECIIGKVIIRVYPWADFGFVQ